MDPLFWILAGIVVGCVIGIVILWRLEARAERQLAIQRQIADRESARLKAIDPLAVIEQTDTRPIPLLPERHPLQAAAQRAATASLAPTLEMTAPNSQPRSSQEITAEPGTAPLPEIQVRPRPTSPIGAAPGQSEDVPLNGKHPATAASGAPVTTRPLAPSSDFELSLDEPASPSAQELLQTTPERASLRASELAHEQRALEEMLETNRARLEECLHSSAPGDIEQATTISLLRNEIAQQRERLLEMIFLEQSYRQIAATVTAYSAQPQQQAAPPNTSRAFGVRRHSLARIEPPDQDQPAPDAQATMDMPT